MVNGIDLFFSLFNNIAIFIAMISIYSYLNSTLSKLNKHLRQLIMGLSFGLFAVGCMYAKIPVFPGVIVDQRNAIIALSSVFGGPAAGFISAILAGVYRAYLGGQGVTAGIIGLNLAAAAGTMMYFWKDSFKNIINALYRSIIAVIIILPGFLFVGDIKTGWNLMLSMALPYGTAILVGILFGGLLLQREKSRLLVEKISKESAEKNRILFEIFPLGITITDEEGNIIETNPIAETIVGKPKFEHEKSSIYNEDWNLIHPDYTKAEVSELAGAVAIREKKKVENQVIGLPQADNSIKWLNVSATPIPLKGYGAAIAYNDITEKKESEATLKSALKEKTLLLQELYHRTKNNMQVIMAIVELQRDMQENSEIKNLLLEIQTRIHAMSLVHEKLYQSSNLSEINFKNYIEELVTWLVYSYKIDTDQVKIHYDLEEIPLLIDTAIPCGLIIQEVISNSLKHAFKGGRKGTLTVKLKEINKNEIELTISDDGPGFSEENIEKSKGKIGLGIIKSLGEDQLDGKMVYQTTPHVKYSLIFKTDLYKIRI